MSITEIIRRRVYCAAFDKHGVVTWIDGRTCLVDFDDGARGVHLPIRLLISSIAPELCDMLPSDCEPADDVVDLGDVT